MNHQWLFLTQRKTKERNWIAINNNPTYLIMYRLGWIRSCDYLPCVLRNIQLLWVFLYRYYAATRVTCIDYTGRGGEGGEQTECEDWFTGYFVNICVLTLPSTDDTTLTFDILGSFPEKETLGILCRDSNRYPNPVQNVWSSHSQKERKNVLLFR